MRLSLTTATPIALGALLVLTGCTAGGEEPGPSESTSGSETSESAEATPEEDEEAAATDDAGCLDGTWNTDVDAVAEAMTAVPGFEEMNPVIEVSGSSTVTFEGGTMTTEYVDQVSSVTIDINGAPITTKTAMDGTLLASYSATDTEITVSDVDLSGVTITNTSVVNGEETVVPGLESAEASGIPLGGVSTYTCTDDTLELMPQVEGVDTGGLKQVLTRD